MATSFPTDIDEFINPQPGDSIQSPSHAQQHSNTNDAIEALEAKVGVDGSTVTTSLDYRVATLENASVDTEQIQDIVAGVLTAGSHTNITVTYDDALNKINLAATYDDEEVMDAIATALTAGTGIVKTYDDILNTITVAVDTNSIATQAYVNTAISNLVDGAPGLLDTLNEIAAAIGDDGNFVTTINTAISSAITTANEYTDTAIQSLGNTIDQNYVPVGDLAQPDGVATLGTDGFVPDNQLNIDERVQDVAAKLITDGSHTNISAVYDDVNNKINLTGAVTYVDEQAVDAVALAFSSGTHTNITVTYDDQNNTISLASTYDNEEVISAIATALTAGTGITKTTSSNPPNYIGDYDNGYSYALNDVVSIPVGSPYGIVGSYFIRSGNPSNPGYPPEPGGATNTSWTLYNFSQTITIGVDTSSIATQTYVNNAISNLVDGAPALLDTLNEIAAAIGDDSNFVTTITNALALKSDIGHHHISTDIDNFTEASQDAAALLLNHTSHDKVTVTYNDVDNKIILNVDEPAHVSNTAPATAQKGDIWYDNTTGTFYVYDESFWVEVSGGTGAISTNLPANLNYLQGTTSNIQDQINLKAPLNNPTFTGTVNLPAGTSIGGADLSVISGATSNLQTQINTVNQNVDGKASLSGATFTGTVSLTSATSIGNVDSAEIQYLNGATSNIQSQINTKAPIASPTFTGTVSGVTKAMVGLSNVDNTSDADKATSTATQTQLNAKAPLNGPVFTGTVSLPSTTSIGSVSSTEIGYLNNLSGGIQTQLNTKAPVESPTFTGTVTLPINTDGSNLVNIPNSSLINSTINFNGTEVALGGDVVIPGALPIQDLTTASKYLVSDGESASWATIDISTKAEVSDLNLKAPLESPAFTGTISGITKSMVGLPNVDNTADLDKPISTATSDALDLKLDLANFTYENLPVSVYMSFEMLPEASSNHGKIAHVHSEGTLYYAHAGSWVKLQKAIPTVDDTEISYLDGVSSNIQAQLNLALADATPIVKGNVYGKTGNAFSQNTSLGNEALRSTTDGLFNTAVGYFAGGNITTGEYNTTIGQSAGSDLVSGLKNIIIGANAQASTTSTSNEITLGDLGIENFRIPGIGINWTSTSKPMPTTISTSLPPGGVGNNGDIWITYTP